VVVAAGCRFARGIDAAGGDGAAGSVHESPAQAKRRARLLIAAWDDVAQTKLKQGRWSSASDNEDCRNANHDIYI
jgi:hypothetical protein